MKLLGNIIFFTVAVCLVFVSAKPVNTIEEDMNENLDVYDVQYYDDSNYHGGYEDMQYQTEEYYDEDEDDTETIESLKIKMKLRSILYELSIMIMEKIIDLK